MKLLQMADPVRYPRMTTAELRETFLLDNLFEPGAIQAVYVDLDRTVIGSAVPATAPLQLETYPELRSEFFCERREVGVLNLGSDGTVTVDEQEFKVSNLDCVYIGRGSKQVSFASASEQSPAAFYLLSYPAHTEFPTRMASFEKDIKPGAVHLGSAETCNKRSIYKAIHLEGIRSCQLVMGFTLLAEGSNWNTMPPHTHMRRSEVYCYFNVDPTQRVMHFMGPPQETRHIVVADKNVVVSPGWSIHAGVGTKNYGFCWGMGGENQRYDDMDPAPLAELL